MKLYIGIEKLNSLCSRSNEGLSGTICSGKLCSNWEVFGSPRGSSKELEKRLRVGCPMLVAGAKFKSSVLEDCQKGIHQPISQTGSDLIYISLSKFDKLSWISKPELGWR